MSKVNKRSSGSICLRSLVLLFCLGSAEPAWSARIAPSRLLPTAELAALARQQGLPALSVIEQSGLGIFGLGEPDQGLVQAGSQSLLLPGGPASGSFAAGFAVALVAAVADTAIEKHNQQSELSRVGRILRGLNLGTVPVDPREDFHRAVAAALLSSGWVDGTPERRDSPGKRDDVTAERCVPREHCLLVWLRWGFSPQLEQLEVQALVSLWSRDLPKQSTRRSHRRQPGAPPRMRKAVANYQNQLFYRSEALLYPWGDAAFDQPLMAAWGQRQRRWIDAQSHHSDKWRSRQHRRVDELLALPMRSGSDPELDAIRRAIDWGRDDAARLRGVLSEASRELQRMLALDLSAAGQAAKNAGRFAERDRGDVYKVVSDGDRQLRYLNDGSLVSAPADTIPARLWPRLVTDASEQERE